jgi:hypothetical protein
MEQVAVSTTISTFINYLSSEIEGELILRERQSAKTIRVPPIYVDGFHAFGSPWLKG